MFALALVAHLALGQAGAADTSIPSLWSAEPLRGGSAASAWAGFAQLGLAYGQGVTDVDDLGAALDLDWATTELRLSAFYRRPLARLGGWDAGGRVALGWYADFGSTWVRDENLNDRGVDVEGAITLSRPAAGGVFSVAGLLPVTFTLWRDGGVLFRPRLALGYETGLWRDVALGARVMAGWRTGLGDSPLSDGSADLTFLVTATYRVF